MTGSVFWLKASARWPIWIEADAKESKLWLRVPRLRSWVVIRDRLGRLRCSNYSRFASTQGDTEVCGSW